MTSERVDAQGVANIAKALQSVLRKKVTWQNTALSFLHRSGSHLILMGLLAVLSYPT